MRNKERLKVYLLLDAYWYLKEALKITKVSEGAVSLLTFRYGRWEMPGSFTPALYARWGCTIPLHDQPERLTLNKSDGLFKAQVKPVTRMIWKEHGLPIPETWIRPEDVTFPCIVRQERHAMGQNFYIAETKEDLERIPFKGPYYYQEIWPNDKEYRVHVLGGEPFNISYKPAIDTDIRRNASITGQELEVTDNYPKQIIDVSLEAMKTLNLDFGAVDIMTNGNKCALLEINASPGLGDDPRKAKAYADYFKKIRYEKYGI